MAKKLFERVLYKDDKIEILTSDAGENSHDIYLGNTENKRDQRKYLFFDRGILKTVGEDCFIERIKQTLSNINRNAPHLLREEDISPEYFAIACARARIREEQNYAEYISTNRR